MWVYEQIACCVASVVCISEHAVFYPNIVFHEYSSTLSTSRIRNIFHIDYLWFNAKSNVTYIARLYAPYSFQQLSSRSAYSEYTNQPIISIPATRSFACASRSIVCELIINWRERFSATFIHHLRFTKSRISYLKNKKLSLVLMRLKNELHSKPGLNGRSVSTTGNNSFERNRLVWVMDINPQVRRRFTHVRMSYRLSSSTGVVLIN